MDSLRTDLLYAWRSITKNRLLAGTVLALLALSLGINTVLLSTVDALVLSPLPVRAPHELVRLVENRPRLGPRSNFQYNYYTALHEHAKSLTAVAGSVEMRVIASDTAERVRVQIVTADYFSTLGVTAEVGRTLTADDDANHSNGSVPVVLSDAFWQRAYARDSTVLGRPLRLQNHTFVVAGVMPPIFRGISIDTTPDLWLPRPAATLLLPEEDRKQLSYELFARLRPGLANSQAQAECVSLAQSTAAAELAGNPKLSPADRYWAVTQAVQLEPLIHGTSWWRTKLSPALLPLLVTANLLLLVVCANLAGLLLTRAIGRQQEIAVRLALGATSARLVRQLSVEYALLASAGGLLGILLAFTALPLVPRLLPPIRDFSGALLPLTLNIQPNLRVLAISLAVCLLAAVCCGLAPVWQAAHTDVQNVLRAARISLRWRSRQVLLAAQVAVCTGLLSSAGLLVVTLHQLRAQNTGVDQDHVVTVSLDPTLTSLTAQQTRQLAGRLVAETRGLPGVSSSAISLIGLMRGTGMKASVAPTGQRIERSSFLNTSLNSVLPGYFDTLGMRILAGADFTGRETAATKPVPSIVNEAFVHQFFPTGSSPIGRTFGSGLGEAAGADFRIVGVVSDAKYRSLREPAPPTVYWLWGRDAAGVQPLVLHVRITVPLTVAIPAIRDTVRRVAPDVPIVEVQTLAAAVDASLWTERLVAWLAAGFAILGALLVGIGLYGLLAYLVLQSTREIGIRAALGATRAHLARWLSAQVLSGVLAGLALGTASAALLGRWLEPLLFGISPYSAPVWIATAALLLLIAAIGIAAPLSRAVRLDPSAALRHE